MSAIRILIVEDELLIAHNLARILKKMGYQVVTIVSSGEAAIQSAAEYRPDLILMDIVIKGAINGIEAARQIQDELRLPIIFLTAYADRETVEKAKQYGGYGFIIKPFKEDQLNATIQIAIGQHALSTEAWNLATTDGLTGIMNRRCFLNVAEKELHRSNRYAQPFSILIIDIDHFKSVNDSYGHGIGDDVIKAVVHDIELVLRRTDYLGRLGGEEFVALLPETGQEQGMAVAQRIVQEIFNHPYQIRDSTLTVSVSVGVASYTPDDASFTALLERADQALYQAKREGRNRAVYHPYSMGDKNNEHSNCGR